MTWKETREKHPQNSDSILQIVPSVLFPLDEISITNHTLKIALESLAVTGQNFNLPKD
jgi:hypothetical protein